jgi:leader peptidase (prepilin peptidase)/N-methyltransferase
MIIYTIIVLVLGALAGVLVNYLADVLPYTRRLSAPICSNCDHRYTAREYLFSFSCPECRRKPPLRNFLVVIGMMILSYLAAWLQIKGLSYWAALPLFTFFALIVTIDMEFKVVLNETSILGAILCLIYGISLNGILPTLLGGAAGYGAMLLLYYGGILFTRVMSRLRHQEIEEVALGFGDVNVAGFLGLLIGISGILQTLLIAVLLGGVISLMVILVMLAARKYQAFSAIPYAPFLILAATIVLFLR